MQSSNLDSVSPQGCIRPIITSGIAYSAQNYVMYEATRQKFYRLENMFVRRKQNALVGQCVACRNSCDPSRYRHPVDASPVESVPALAIGSRLSLLVFLSACRPTYCKTFNAAQALTKQGGYKIRKIANYGSYAVC
jgi:hypothetical protein